MNSQSIILNIDQLRHRLRLPLPSTIAHQLMDPLTANQRKWDHLGIAPRLSAVMILLYQEDGIWKFPLIQRPEYEGSHSGQVALPGGKKDDHDAHLIDTALRETFEEIGIDPLDITILGELTEIYVPPSNFKIQPVIGWMRKKPMFIPDNHEVKEIYSISIDDLINPDMISQKTIVVSKQIKLKASCFTFGEVVVWGATAMILSELATIVKEINHE